MGACTSKQRASEAVIEAATLPASSPRLLGAQSQRPADDKKPGEVVAKETSFEVYPDKDAFPGENARTMHVVSQDLGAVYDACIKGNYGGFALWEGGAYFRDKSKEACRQNLVTTPGATFYVNTLQTDRDAPTEVSILTYNLFWWNLYGQNGGRDGSASKLIAAAQPSIMGFQETEDVDRVLNEGNLKPEYIGVPGPRALAMAYKAAEWDLLGQGVADVAEDEPEQYYGARSVQWLRLRQKGTGRIVFVANHHGPLRVNSGGVGGGRKTAENLLQVIRTNSQQGDAVVLLGDFNAQTNSETVAVLRQSIPLVYTGVSFGGVDHFFSALEVVSSENLGAGGSDHDALMVTFKI